MVIGTTIIDCNITKPKNGSSLVRSAILPLTITETIYEEEITQNKLYIPMMLQNRKETIFHGTNGHQQTLPHNWSRLQ
jgi:hypothetical protein